MKENQGSGQSADARMPFTTHLAELRSRLIKSFLAIGIAFVGCFTFADKILSILTAPLLRIQAPGLSLIGTAVTEAFFTKMKVSFIAAVFAAFPILLWQAWQFVAPGLYEHEKRYTRGFVFFGTFFFLVGAAFCYEVIFHYGLSFFLHRYEALKVQPTLRIGEYLSFASKLMLAFGIAFELPVAAYFLTRVGLIDHRILIRQFRYAVLVIAILAAILTPPDLVSQILLILPLSALYGVSIGVAYFVRRRRDRSDAD